MQGHTALMQGHIALMQGHTALMQGHTASHVVTPAAATLQDVHGTMEGEEVTSCWDVMLPKSLTME
jgi:hypothetical protein